MIRSKILQLTVATALIAGAQSAVACSTAAWTGGVTGTVGEPSAGTPQFRRYSGRCSLTASAAGQTAIDNSPTAETTYKARFYFYTGGLTGSARIFEARNTGGTAVIHVTYNQAAGQLVFGALGTASTVNVPAAADRYYGIEVRWAAAGGLTAVVRGNNAATATTVNLAGSTGGVVDTAVLGWISGGGLTGNQPNFDEFDSRRTSDIGFLCRGNAVNTDTIISVADRNAITANILGSSLATGQPDLTEDGVVAVADRNAITAIILAGTGGTHCGGVN